MRLMTRQAISDYLYLMFDNVSKTYILNRKQQLNSGGSKFWVELTESNVNPYIIKIVVTKNGKTCEQLVNRNLKPSDFLTFVLKENFCSSINSI
jgi:hypothetical protein